MNAYLDLAELRAEERILMTMEGWAELLYGEFKEFFPENAVEYFVS